MVLPQKPPAFMPPGTVPMIDPDTGMITPPWYGYFRDLSSQATPFEQLSLPTPDLPVTFVYTVVHAGSLLVIGGTISNISLARGVKQKITIPDIGVRSGFIPVSQNDVVTFKYTVLPVIWHIPNGNPS